MSRREDGHAGNAQTQKTNGTPPARDAVGHARSQRAPVCTTKTHAFGLLRWLETTVSGVFRRARRARFPCKSWWTASGSNRRPPPCKPSHLRASSRRQVPLRAFLSVKRDAEVSDSDTWGRGARLRSFAERLQSVVQTGRSGRMKHDAQLAGSSLASVGPTGEDRHGGRRWE